MMRSSRVYVILLCVAGCGPKVPSSMSRLSPGDIVYAFTDRKDQEGIVGGYFPHLDPSVYSHVLDRDFDPHAVPHLSTGDRLVVVKDDDAMDTKTWDNQPNGRTVEVKAETGMLAGKTGSVRRRDLELRPKR